MYHTALPLQWSYLQPVLDNMPSSSSPLYFTGCTERCPVVPIDQSPFRTSNSRRTLLPSPILPQHPSPLRDNGSIPKTKVPTENVSKQQPDETRVQSIAQTAEETPVSQVSIETLLGTSMENIIQLVKSATEKPESLRVGLINDSAVNSKTEMRSRGVKRQLDFSSPSARTNESFSEIKRRRFDEDDWDDVVVFGTPPKVLPVIKETVKCSPCVQTDTSSDEELLEKVSKLIWKLYIHNKQSEEMFVKKTRLRDALHNLLKNVFPYCGLYIVGSSLTGLGSNSSDLDMCLMISHSEIDQEIEATGILNMILRVLRKCEFVQNAQLIPAKVPILKFYDTVSGVEVDLNINNAVGIRNTQLMHCYANMDWRVQPLVVLVKMWAKDNDINDAKNMTLSSYSLVLMVIHFLQFSASPPIVPCLQESMPDKFQPNSDIRQLLLREELAPFHSNNKANLGELMLAFLEYYSHTFQFHENVISVRTGGVIPKHIAMNCRSPKNKRGHWKYLSIEEPFDRTNTARSVFDESAFQRILTVFQSSFEKLKETKDMSLILDVDHDLL